MSLQKTRQKYCDFSFLQLSKLFSPINILAAFSNINSHRSCFDAMDSDIAREKLHFNKHFEVYSSKLRIRPLTLLNDLKTRLKNDEFLLSLSFICRRWAVFIVRPSCFLLTHSVLQIYIQKTAPQPTKMILFQPYLLIHSTTFTHFGT